MCEMVCETGTSLAWYYGLKAGTVSGGNGTCV